MDSCLQVSAEGGVDTYEFNVNKSIFLLNYLTCIPQLHQSSQKKIIRLVEPRFEPLEPDAHYFFAQLISHILFWESEN